MKLLDRITRTSTKKNFAPQASMSFSPQRLPIKTRLVAHWVEDDQGALVCEWTTEAIA